MGPFKAEALKLGQREAESERDQAEKKMLLKRKKRQVSLSVFLPSILTGDFDAVEDRSYRSIESHALLPSSGEEEKRKKATERNEIDRNKERADAHRERRQLSA